MLYISLRVDARLLGRLAAAEQQCGRDWGRGQQGAEEEESESARGSHWVFGSALAPSSPPSPSFALLLLPLAGRLDWTGLVVLRLLLSEAEFLVVLW